MVKHTPGPWVADEFCQHDDASVRVGTTDGSATYYHRTQTVAVCQFSTYGGRMSGEDNDPDMLTAEANARLIAAAPDLLAELKYAADELEHSGLAFDHPSIARLRAAIAKAEGQP